MSTAFYIARRYLFSKKSTNVINVISAISVTGVAVATMAMVVVMSVFNGFSDLVATFFTAFDPQIAVVPAEGKACAANDPVIEKLKHASCVEMYSESIEDQALAIYGDQQAMVHIKGVDDNFEKLTHIRDICYGDGSFDLHAADLQYGIPGIRLAQQLNMSAQYQGYLHVYAPNREGQLDMMNPMEGFVADSLLSPGVVFAVQQGKYDKDYILTSIDFARSLFMRDGEISRLEIKLKAGTDAAAAKKELTQIAGSKFRIMDRYEQQAETFNIIGSLSMLIIDKKNDAATLRALGARPSLIKRIFIFEGWLISIIGAVVGVALGLLLCLLQQQFGLVSLGQSSGAFVVDAYPVSVHYSDVALIFLTVVAVGFVSVLYPARQVKTA